MIRVRSRSNGVRILRTLARRLLIIGCVTIATGCAVVPKRTAVPFEVIDQAGFKDIPAARTWGDEWPSWSQRIFTEHSEAELRSEFAGIYGKPLAFLAISGGGANGAFGAGLFNGWTTSGTRPEFAMVTGVSIGALTAPFVFLGPEYDDQLKTIFTTISTKDVVKKRGFITGLFADALADSTPLQKLIARYITADMVAEIAREHQRGRRLFIGTVNLDAARSVIWNIGAIAGSNYPDKLELIREVLRASASIPVAFPPVAIPVEVQGKAYEELHVDGGTGTQVFVYPADVDFDFVVEKLKVQGKPKIYVVRNAFIDPEYQLIERRTLPIASRTVASLIRTQGIGDLYQIYALCERDGNDFNLAYIPENFDEKPAKGFDPVYMTKLFELGFQLGRDGYAWKKGPPGFADDDQTR